MPESFSLRLDKYPDRTALLAPEGRFTYGHLQRAVERVAGWLAAELGPGDRVAFLIPPGFRYVAVLWGIWRAGGIAVPLAVSHPRPELAYVIEDAGASLLIAAPELAERLQPIAVARNLSLWQTPTLLAQTASQSTLPAVEPEQPALILYTSGTTGSPKGVVIPHRAIKAQVDSLVAAWGWTAGDHILHTLPLHHVHGIINALICPLAVGAACEMLPRFEADRVWERFLAGRVTLFMAVPTIYNRLIAAWEAASPRRQRAMSSACAGLRLMVSGSAALPVSTLEKWRAISGHTLLERYGMTEIGMALSNPLHGERIPGHVGRSLPGVEVRLVDETGRVIRAEGRPGQIQVRGPTLFREYWGRPEATRRAFQAGWFCTGDIAQVEGGVYRILGRRSVDIIKTGGYKVSALEIEEVLRTHPAIRECAVVGVADVEWGERVCVALTTEPDRSVTLPALRSWAKERLAPYKVPTRLRVVADLPRNAMGKVTKPAIKKLFE